MWLTLNFARAADCEALLRQLLGRALVQGELTVEDLKPPFAAPFNPFAGKVPTSTNIQLRRAFTQLGYAEDASAVVAAVLAERAEAQRHVQKAQTQTAGMLAPRVVYQTELQLMGDWTAGTKELSFVEGRILFAGSFTSANLVWDLTDPHTPTVVRIPLVNRGYLPMHAFAGGGEGRVFVPQISKLLRLDKPTATFLPHEPDLGTKFQLSRSVTVGDQTKIITGFRKILPSRAGYGYTLLDFHGSAAPQTLLKGLTWSEEPQVDWVAGRPLLSFQDQDSATLFFDFDGQPAGRTGAGTEQPAVPFADAGRLKAVYLGHDPFSAQSGLYVAALPTGKVERSMPTPPFASGKILLFEDGATTYAVLGFGSNEIGVVNLQSGVCKTIFNETAGSPVSVVEVGGEPLLIWGSLAGEVSFVPLRGPDTRVLVFATGLSSIRELIPFFVGGEWAALCFDRHGRLALLELTWRER